MLGQPMSMLIPQVLGFKLTGELREGTTATDLVLTVAELLRQTGVVGKFVDFYGPGVVNVPLANRATLGNMSPEYGSTCAIFPIDAETLTYLRLTGRPEPHIRLVEATPRSRAWGMTLMTSRSKAKASNWTWPVWNRRSPGRSDPRTASRCRWPRMRSVRCSPVAPGRSCRRAGSMRR